MHSSRKRRPVAVLDTNVWVSAMIWGGSPARIVRAAECGEIDIVTSMEIIGEIGETLAYPKLEKVYLGASVSKRDLLEAVLRVARIVEVDVRVEAVPHDPADDKFIECALASGAGYIVSGDRHLLDLGSYSKVRILSVSEFLTILNRPAAT